jgi:hypothetical protein
MRNLIPLFALICFLFGASCSFASDLLYLKERVSIITDNGVSAFAPGTKVHRIASTPDGFTVVTEDGVELKVRAAQVTMDQTEGEKLAGAEAATQDAANAQARLIAEQQAAAASQQPSPVPLPVSIPVPQPTATPPSLPLPTDLYDPQSTNTVVHHHRKSNQ